MVLIILCPFIYEIIDQKNGRKSTTIAARNIIDAAASAAGLTKNSVGQNPNGCHITRDTPNGYE